MHLRRQDPGQSDNPLTDSEEHRGELGTWCTRKILTILGAMLRPGGQMESLVSTDYGYVSAMRDISQALAGVRGNLLLEYGLIEPHKQGNVSLPCSGCLMN